MVLAFFYLIFSQTSPISPVTRLSESTSLLKILYLVLDSNFITFIFIYCISQVLNNKYTHRLIYVASQQVRLKHPNLKRTTVLFFMKITEKLYRKLNSYLFQPPPGPHSPQHSQHNKVSLRQPKLSHRPRPDGVQLQVPGGHPWSV